LVQGITGQKERQSSINIHIVIGTMAQWEYEAGWEVREGFSEEVMLDHTFLDE
jgi:hypothetical protein